MITVFDKIILIALLSDLPVLIGSRVDYMSDQFEKKLSQNSFD